MSRAVRYVLDPDAKALWKPTGFPVVALGYEPSNRVIVPGGNVSLNGLENVYAYNQGLDEKAGSLKLHRPGIDRGSSTASESRVKQFEDDRIPSSVENISVLTLDSFAPI